MWRTIDGIVRCRSEHASRSSVQNSAKDTYSLFRKPGMAVLPPIRPMFAQNMPCRSPGKSAMLAATVALSPACSRPVRSCTALVQWDSENQGEQGSIHSERLEEIIADIGRMEEYLWDREPLVGHPQGLLAALVERFARITYTPWPAGGVVREYVLLDYRIPVWPRSSSPNIELSWKRAREIRAAGVRNEGAKKRGTPS